MSQGQKVVKYLAIIFAACLTITILGVILNIVVSICGAFIPDNSRCSSSTNECSEIIKSEYDNTFKNVKEIRIDSGVYSVDVLKDNSVEGVRVVTKDVTSKIEVKYDVDSKYLVVEEDEVFDNLFKRKHTSKGKIIMYVQDGIQLDKLDVDMGVGNFTIDGIEIDNLDIDCGVGSLTCKNVKAKKADIDGGVGELECKDVSFSDLDLDGGVGEIDISGELLGKVHLSAGMGELNVDINGKRSDYNLKVETGLGAITIDGEKYKDTNNYNNSQSNLLDIEGGVGSVRVDFH